MKDTRWNLLYVLLLFAALPSWGTSSLTHICPDEFVGRVAFVSDLQTHFLEDPVLSKVQVVLDVEESLSGDKRKTRTVTTLKNSTTTFEEGDRFHIMMRDGFLCSVKELKLSLLELSFTNR